jgi:hypothetical protein
MTTYVIDIDNTICSTKDSDYENSIANWGRIAKINDLYRNGHRIIYWTARGGKSGKDWTDFTTRQLREFGCLYDELRMGKPSYDVWIDDKATNAEDYFK